MPQDIDEHMRLMCDVLVLDYLDKPNRRMCSLYLSLMNKTGVELAAFSDSKERLAD